MRRWEDPWIRAIGSDWRHDLRADTPEAAIDRLARDAAGATAGWDLAGVAFSRFLSLPP